jgi:hypothetical protein
MEEGNAPHIHFFRTRAIIVSKGRKEGRTEGRTDGREGGMTRKEGWMEWMDGKGRTDGRTEGKEGKEG